MVINIRRSRPDEGDKLTVIWCRSNPPPEGVNPQPDAEENRDGKPVPASAIKLSAAGGYPVITYRCARVA